MRTGAARLSPQASQAEAYASAHGLRARWGINALGMVIGALIDLGRWDEAEAALTRVRHYELPDLLELQVEAMAFFLETGRGHFESANRRAPRVRLLAERFQTGHAAVLALLALWQDDPLAARAAIEDGPEDPFPRHRIWALAAGIRAEADLAVLARARHAEPELAEARSRGAALLARLRAVVEDVVARVPILTRQMVTIRTEAEAEVGAPRGPARSGPLGLGGSRVAATGDAVRDGLRPHAAGGSDPRSRARSVQGCPRAERSSRHCRSSGSGAAPSGHRQARGPRRSRARRGGQCTASDWPTRFRATRVAPEAARCGIGFRSRPVDLTRREREVLALLGAGRSNAEIGALLYVSKKTVSVHVANIKAKLGATSRVEMAIFAMQSGFVEGPASTSS